MTEEKLAVTREISEADSIIMPKDRYYTAGFTMFFVMSYILVANPLVLSCSAGAPPNCVAMPAGPVLLATALTAGIFSIAAGLVTNTPSAIAPGMAFNIYFVQFLSQNHIHWSAGLILCSFSAIMVFLLTIGGARQAIIRAVPRPLARSIGGGIGALLSEASIKYLYIPKSDNFEPISVGLFLLGLVIICPLYFYGRNYAKKAGISPLRKKIADTLGCAAFVLSIICIWLINMWFVNPGQIAPLGSDVYYIWQAHVTLDDIKTISNPAAISFAAFLIYMLMIDIVGSPYDMVEHAGFGKFSEEEKDRIVRRGFMIDSAANIVAPIFGTSPVVFFAESHSARLVGAMSGRASVVAGSLFLLVAAVVVGASLAGIRLPMPPTIAIAPTLFVVGAVVVAETLQADGTAEQGTSKPAELGSFFDDPTKLLDTLPAAVTIILTPIINIQFGLAGGIVAFFLLAQLLPPDRRKKEINERPAFIALAALAFSAILVMAWVNLQSWWPSTKP